MLLVAWELSPRVLCISIPLIKVNSIVYGLTMNDNREEVSL